VEKTYHGFDLNFDAIELEHVVLVSSEGEVSMYAIDDPKRVSGLVEYLNNEGPPCQILGCFKRCK